MEGKKESLVKLLTSVIIPHKGGCPMRRLEREYFELVGSKIPFRQFGHPSLPDFLKTIKDFYITFDREGERLINCRTKEDLKHVQVMARPKRNMGAAGSLHGQTTHQLNRQTPGGNVNRFPLFKKAIAACVPSPLALRPAPPLPKSPEVTKKLPGPPKGAIPKTPASLKSSGPPGPASLYLRPAPPVPGSAVVPPPRPAQPIAKATSGSSLLRPAVPARAPKASCLKPPLSTPPSACLRPAPPLSNIITPSQGENSPASPINAVEGGASKKPGAVFVRARLAKEAEVDFSQKNPLKVELSDNPVNCDHDKKDIAELCQIFSKSLTFSSPLPTQIIPKYDFNGINNNAESSAESTSSSDASDDGLVNGEAEAYNEIDTAVTDERVVLLPNDLACLKELNPMNISAGQFLEVAILYVGSPTQFVVQPWLQIPNLQQHQITLNLFYENMHAILRPVSIEDLDHERFYAASHKGMWYRVRVKNVIHAKDPVLLSVRFVDYGHYEPMSLSALKPLASHLKNLPMMAARAKLADIGAVNSDWCQRGLKWFCDRVHNKPFVAIVKDKQYIEEDGLLELAISLVDTSAKDKDIYVEQELVDQGMAVWLD